MQTVLAKSHPEIHHIGSTAIPGIKAKPVIDIIILLPPPLVQTDVEIRLSQIGYRFLRQIERRLFFGNGLRASPMGNVHIFSTEDGEARDTIRFRDRLRADPVLRTEYEKLKVKLAEKFPTDIEQYSSGKTEFILRVLSRPSR